MTTKSANKLSIRVIEIPVRHMCKKQVKQWMPFWKGEVTNGQDIVIDMRQVDKIDSAGLATLVALLDAAERTGSKLRIANMQASVRTVASLVRLHKVIEIYSSVDLALHSLTRY